MSLFKSKISGEEALDFLEREDRISQRDYLLISQFISRRNFNLSSLEKIISTKNKKINDLEYDLEQLDLFDGVEISIINKLIRLHSEKRTTKQDQLLKKYSIQKTLDRSNLFREVLSDLIKEERIDLSNLIKIRDVYVDYLPEATLSPRSSRSQLEASPTRRFTTSPMLSPRSRSPSPSPRSPSPITTPRKSPLRNSGQLLKSPRRLLRKSKSYK